MLLPPEPRLTSTSLRDAEYVSVISPYIMNSVLFFYPGYAIQNNLTPFISMQNLYNLVYREEEREMMPLLKVCIQLDRIARLISPQHLGVGCIPWSPLARGALTRPWDDKSIRSESDA